MDQDVAVLTVIAQYRAAPGSGNEVAAVLAVHGVASRDEAGCLRFDVYRSVDDTDCFVLYEQYVDEAAFEAHRRTPHFRHNIESTLAGLLAERTWHRYDRVGADTG
jgi:quinol monooxygenase YgiN